jgi:hypothetical protein
VQLAKSEQMQTDQVQTEQVPTAWAMVQARVSLLLHSSIDMKSNVECLSTE